ncbi:MAG: putative entry exclusion protein TrbK-alt [Caenibius sp.]|nr:putative entry exclusion protein TrbK-alt [Novosphingobium sp.]
MDSKLLARIGAAVFVGLAIAMTLVQLHEEPQTFETRTVTRQESDRDPLSAQIRACAQMGELALSSPDCRAAWAEKRRRFLGVDPSEANSGLQDLTPPPVTVPPVPEQRGED